MIAKLVWCSIPLLAFASACSKPVPLTQTSPTSAAFTVSSSTSASVGEAERACANEDFADCSAQCAKGNATSCKWLGGMYLYAQNGAPKNRAKAAEALAKACDGGDDEGCLLLGAQYFSGDGVAKDPARGAATYKRACDLQPVRCDALAAEMMSGHSIPKDLAQAAVLNEKACRAEDEVSCLRLGLMYERGVGVPKDPARANQLFAKGCAGKLPTDCKAAKAVAWPD